MRKKNKWMEGLQENIFAAITESITENYIEERDILVYMPPYFNSMYAKFLSPHAETMKTFNLRRLNGMYGTIAVVDGYENLVVIAAKESALKGIEPIKIPIP